MAIEAGRFEPCLYVDIRLIFLNYKYKRFVTKPFILPDMDVE